MKKAIYPGSFDPVTLGHLDVIRRASKITDELIVGVLNNNSKNKLFSAKERVKMLEEVTADIPNVRIMSFEGLLIDFAKKEECQVIIRGIRATTDYEYEMQMAQTNRIMDPELDTLFLTTSLEYAYLSSSTVKEVAMYGGDISRFLLPNVEAKLKDKMNEKYKAQK